jgi:hypothetical protein
VPLRLGAFLSLTGRYARFGRQAAVGLEAWRSLARDVELRLEDDAGEAARIEAGLPRLAASCDLLLGPYSTGLARAALRAMDGIDGLLWNHGGAGDDVQGSAAGRVVSVLTPAGRYADPFLRMLARAATPRPLRIAAGRGAFGRQVAAGAEALAGELAIPVVQEVPDGQGWDLLCAGGFDEDVAAVRGALAAPARPAAICAVAAGVRAFAAAVEQANGIYGIAQWLPGVGEAPEVGPTEADFLAACRRLGEAAPDYPAVQAAATAALAVHCARLAGSTEPAALRAAAANLRARTMFGDFAIDETGVQVAHRTVLVRWQDGEVARIG